MSEYIGFNPDWISPPGDTMVDILAERQISTSDFARQMGQSPRHAQQLLQGQLEITPELAQQLEAVLGAPASFWATRESQYRNAVVRLEQESKRQSATQWLKERCQAPAREDTRRETPVNGVFTNRKDHEQ